MIEVQSFTESNQPEWDPFVLGSKNGSFLFLRDYLEYHKDRFPDCSLLFRHQGRVAGLLPATRIGDEVSSHAGLTFGGIVSDGRMTTPLMMEIFEQFISFFQKQGVRRIVYKASPSFYHDLPADEDLYALFRFGAKLFRRDLGSIVAPGERIPFQTRRERAILRAGKSGVVVRESTDWVGFWKLLETVLRERYQLKPVHSLDEILLLRSRFPKNIRLFGGFRDQDWLAGVVIYENRKVAHSQYIAASDAGKETGALDLVFNQLLRNVYLEKKWFSFGVSTEKGGQFLNVGLVEQKEGFGARACTQDFYEILL